MIETGNRDVVGPEQKEEKVTFSTFLVFGGQRSCRRQKEESLLTRRKQKKKRDTSTKQTAKQPVAINLSSCSVPGKSNPDPRRQRIMPLCIFNLPCMSGMIPESTLSTVSSTSYYTFPLISFTGSYRSRYETEPIGDAIQLASKLSCRRISFFSGTIDCRTCRRIARGLLDYVESPALCTTLALDIL